VDWERAIAFGIDVTLLEANLDRSPMERLQELIEMNRLCAEFQARTLPPETRARLEKAELHDKFGSLLAYAP
jgi:hypothetical protein